MAIDVRSLQDWEEQWSRLRVFKGYVALFGTAVFTLTGVCSISILAKFAAMHGIATLDVLALASAFWFFALVDVSVAFGAWSLLSRRRSAFWQAFLQSVEHHRATTQPRLELLAYARFVLSLTRWRLLLLVIFGLSAGIPVGGYYAVLAYQDSIGFSLVEITTVAIAVAGFAHGAAIAPFCITIWHWVKPWKLEACRWMLSVME